MTLESLPSLPTYHTQPTYDKVLYDDVVTDRKRLTVSKKGLPSIMTTTIMDNEWEGDDELPDLGV